MHLPKRVSDFQSISFSLSTKRVFFFSTMNCYLFAGCFEFDVDYNGNDLKRFWGVSSPFACQNMCAGTALCTHFTWSPEIANGACWLKSSGSGPNTGGARISGPRRCPYTDQACAHSSIAGKMFAPEPSSGDSYGDICRATDSSGQWYPPSGCDQFEGDGAPYSVFRGTINVPCQVFSNQGTSNCYTILIISNRILKLIFARLC